MRGLGGLRVAPPASSHGLDPHSTLTFCYAFLSLRALSPNSRVKFEFRKFEFPAEKVRKIKKPILITFCLIDLKFGTGVPLCKIRKNQSPPVGS